MRSVPSSLRSLSGALWSRRYPVLYAVLVAWFLLRVASFHDPLTGFTSLETFGDYFESHRLGALRQVPIHTFDRSYGYDGQFYALIAVAGDPFDPELQTALDNPGYRCVKIVLPALAHVIGLGRPSWVLDVYALVGVVSWLCLAWVLARWWFPPSDLHNLLRWMGTLFGAGMLMSVKHSLTDGPSLLVLAVGVHLVEKGRWLIAALVMAIAGGVRELNVLGAAAFVPSPRSGKGWAGALAAGAICVLPAAIWYSILLHHYGAFSELGRFDLPLVGFLGKLREIQAGPLVMSGSALLRQLGPVLAIGTQIAFVVVRPRTDSPWWWVAATFSALGIVMGPVFWVGWPAAICRVVLPLTLGFNILCPRGKAGLALLLAGNVTVLSAGVLLRPPPIERTILREGIRYEYGEAWLGLDGSGSHTTRWSSGSTTMRFHNPTGETREVTLIFELFSKSARTVTLATGPLERRIVLDGRRRLPAVFGPFPLAPGVTTVSWTTPDPPWIEPTPPGRPLAFQLRDLRVLTGDVFQTGLLGTP